MAVAFPGAMGYGASTIGARAAPGPMVVARVTSLANSGTGTLRDALSLADGNTGVFVVFTVGGYINLTESILLDQPYVTILGQTAPGDGVCLRWDPANADGDSLMLISGRDTDGANANQIIVRGLSFKHGREASWSDNAGCLTIRNAQNIIVHECTIQFGSNEMFNLQWNTTTGSEDSENITFSRCVFSDSLITRGVLWDEDGNTSLEIHNVDMFECLLANNNSRQPKVTGDSIRLIGNVMYGSSEGGGGQYNVQCDLINNYYREDPLSDWVGINDRPFFHENASGTDAPLYYRRGNVVDTPAGIVTDQTLIMRDQVTNLEIQGSWISPNAIAEVATIPIQEMADATAYYTELVTNGRVGNYRRITEAGTWEDRADADLARVISDVANRQAQSSGGPYSSSPYVDFPSQLDEGGMATLAAGTAYTDSDSDGMGDAWETANSPGNAVDIPAGQEFTELERFANGPEDLTPPNPPTGLQVTGTA